MIVKFKYMPIQITLSLETNKNALERAYELNSLAKLDCENFMAP